MDRNRKTCLLLAMILLPAACSPLPPETTETEFPQPSPTTALLLSTPTALETQAPLSPTLAPEVELPQVDKILVTIPNPEAWSGKEGAVRPDWKGWGAETFIAAPDGTFWIADTAVYPNRLLNVSTQGGLIQEISLGNQVTYAMDLVITQGSLWVLDNSALPPKVLQLNMRGEPISSVEIQEEGFSLLVGEAGELLLFGVSGYRELVDASGAISNRLLEGLAYYGHTYQTGAYDPGTGIMPILMDGISLDLPPDFLIEMEAFTGINPDGSFAVAGYVPDGNVPEERQVRYYRASGELLGMARQYPQTFYKDWNHHLAFGPGGEVYQLLSNPDHSVQIVRLGFSTTLPPRQVDLAATPTPFEQLLPSESPESDMEIARNTLIAFFSDLSAGNYAPAADKFGGAMNEFAREIMPGETVDQYWEYLCGFMWCLPVAVIPDVDQVSESEYIFYTVFMHPDGTRFEIGPCCGMDPASAPPVWQFAYPVQKVDGTWKVMRAPLFTP